MKNISDFVTIRKSLTLTGKKQKTEIDLNKNQDHANEEELFKARFEENKDVVFRLCLGYFQHDHSLAEDAMQEAFIKAWLNRKQFRDDANWQTWIYRITINTCLLKIKQEKKEFEKAQAFSSESPWEENPEKEQSIKLMHTCIQKLKPENRMLILMVLEGIPYSTIESTLGLSPENLRVKIHRIKKELNICMTHGKSR